MRWFSKLVAQWVRASVQDLFGVEHLWQALYLKSIAHRGVQRKKTGYSPSKT